MLSSLLLSPTLRYECNYCWVGVCPGWGVPAQVQVRKIKKKKSFSYSQEPWRQLLIKVWKSLHFLRSWWETGAHRHSCDLGMQVGSLAVLLCGCLCTLILTNSFVIHQTYPFEFWIPTLCDRLLNFSVFCFLIWENDLTMPKLHIWFEAKIRPASVWYVIKVSFCSM